MTTPKKTAKTSGNEARELADLSEDIGIRFKYPNSERVYLQGSREDIRVPLREIRQDDTYTAQGTEAGTAGFPSMTPAACTAIRRHTST